MVTFMTTPSFNGWAVDLGMSVPASAIEAKSFYIAEEIIIMTALRPSSFYRK